MDNKVFSLVLDTYGMKFAILEGTVLLYVYLATSGNTSVSAWTNFSLQDEPWAEFSTLEVAACIILCTYGPVLQNNLTYS